MKTFDGYMHGVGIGGWLTNFKRLRFIPAEMSTVVTTGDREHFEEFITECDVEQIASWGCDHIRLAFDYVFFETEDNHMVLRTDNLGFTYLDRFAGWCAKYKLNLLFDLHRAAGSSCEYVDDSSLMDDPHLQERFLWLWREMAEHYKSAGPEIAFELLNEVHDPEPKKWNALARRAIAAIREIDSKRVIVVGSNNYGAAASFNDLEVFDDDRTVYSFHSYFPHEFTHQKAVIHAGLATYNRYMQYPSPIEPYLDFMDFNKCDKTHYTSLGQMDRRFLEDTFRPVFEFQDKYNKPIYCGEFGVIRHCDMKSRENYYRDVIDLCNEHQIAHAAWNYLTAPYDANRFSIVDDWDRKPLSDKLIRIIC